MEWIYLDNNATTQPAAQVVDAMHEVLAEGWANPSSVHRFGQMVRQRVELARLSVARLINCRDRTIVFTAGGTESNNLALRGVLLRTGGKGDSGTTSTALITTRLEHSAIREPAEALAEQGVHVAYVPIDADGIVHAEALIATLAEHARHTTLVSIMWANNETGVIQPIAQLARAVQEWSAWKHEGSSGCEAASGGMRVLFHCDATQAVGKTPIDVREAGVDLLTFSAHKFHGPKGAGGLYVRNGVGLESQSLGGPQERKRRGGTEHVAGIVGTGVAADLAALFLDDPAQHEQLAALRDRFERALLNAVPDTTVNGASMAQTPRLWTTTNIGFAHLEAEAILLGLSEKGVCASAGAACSSGSLEPSPVLLAMGVPEHRAHGSVRFSLSRFTTDAQIERALQIVPEVVQRLARTLPMAGNRVQELG